MAMAIIGIHGNDFTSSLFVNLCICACWYLSNTELSELCQKKLMTEDELKRVNEDGVHLGLLDRLVRVQYSKPADVVATTADILEKFEHKEEAKKLRGWFGVSDIVSDAFHGYIRVTAIYFQWQRNWWRELQCLRELLISNGSR